ncbi:MAG: DUF3352 domain-containing protein [Cyanosarcina radialis HA8281-LM2]|jgi:hypothetical protein|nr:DUF3352 domain-containing protein [Cyanosarcina radialis HA8281-LM2]
MSERRPNLLIPIAAGAAAIGVVGGIAAYFYFKVIPARQAGDVVSSAKVIPDEAWMAGFVSTDPKAWAQLEKFGTPELRKMISQGMQQLTQETEKQMKECNIDYQKDFQEAAGSVMFAALPPAKTAEGGTTQPSFLAVVGIKDKLKALDLSNKLKGCKGVTAKESDYKGLKITEIAGKGSPSFSAVLDNHVVFSDNRKSVELSIDTYKGDPSLASNSEATNALAKSLDLQNPVAALYIPDYGNLIEQTLAANPNSTAFPPELKSTLKGVKSIAMGIGIDNEGIRVKQIGKFDPAIIKWEYKTSPGKIVSQFPADTFALVSGEGLSRYWLSAVELYKNYPQFQQGLEQARVQLKQATDLDLDKEILGWMNGEYALALIPANQGVLSYTGFGGALLFDTSDRQTAETALKKLDAYMQKNGVTLAPRKVGNIDVTEWQSPGAPGALLGHGWLDNDTVFVALGGPISDIISTKPSQSLDNSQNFKEVTGSLPKPNAGYFYINMDKVTEVLNSNPFIVQSGALNPQTQEVLKSIRGFGGTSTQVDNSTVEVEFLLSLKPAK